jgi:peptidyl-dipeptidase Dcp
MSPRADRNPLLDEPVTPFGVPPFGEIEPAHFPPAFDRALEAHASEAAAIGRATEAPTFENTITALENSGRLFARVNAVFETLAGAHANEALLAIEREIAPRLAAHWNAVHTDAALFARIEDLHRRRDRLGLTAEQARVLDRYYTIFRRAGAGLDASARRRLAEVVERLAVLATMFSQNVLADEQANVLVLEGEEDLAGLPGWLCEAARAAAEERGLTGKHVVTLSRSMIEPFLRTSSRRDLREKAFRAFLARGDGGGKTDNKAIIAEMTALRAELARLIGYPTFAHYRIEDCMAKTPEAARALLDQVWRPARRRALAERADLQALVQAEGGNFALAPWDWRYYAEKLRKARFDLDEGELAPYLSLERMIGAAFEVASRLFGLSFVPCHGVPVWHPDVRVWEVRGEEGEHIGLFFGDYFARPTKRSGAWMHTLRHQERFVRDIRPWVVNVMNFCKPGVGEVTLLSYDDARTLFHEFGHALHALLSNVSYPIVSGTEVAIDFVELPSQLFECWLDRPEFLNAFARHYRTGEPMPAHLIERLIASRTFNQGFATLEYLACALIDLDLHTGQPPAAPVVAAFEEAALDRIGMPPEIAMRHRLPHFSHLFAGEDYAAAYYSYMWSEMLDADAFEAFEETGDIFDRATARRLCDCILAVGGARDPAEAYIAFRGRLPAPDALLRRRGLAQSVAS